GSRDVVPANVCKVIVDGVEPEIVSWSPDKVVCRLARDGSGSAGDVLVQVGARPLLRGDVSFDNAANRSTGSERVNVTLSLEAPFGLGDRLGLAASKTRGTDYLRASASLPVGALGWRVGASASALRYRVLDAFNTTPGRAPEGHGQAIGLDAQYPLWRSHLAQWNASFGLDQKRQTNDDDNFTPEQLQRTRAARNRSVSAGINGYAFDTLGRGGQTQASAQFVVGRLSLAGSPLGALIGDATTENTQGGYQLLRWSLARTQALTPTLSLAATANGQFASRNLDSSEKLYLGGFGAVNAYPSGEAGGSSGQIVNLELRQQLAPGLQLAAFFDWGQLRQYQRNERADGNGPLVAHNSVTLKGPGLALNYRADNGVHLRAVYAHRMGANPLATANGNDSDGSLHRHRLWLSAGITF
ncbi:MAG: ShlB/FhaC/HecB family hemolysin secretion/activation protein, partial [Solirubrobacteraceae bacterium]|nr:ShlB/FhaC/HecB family hemolysin secretion/activation protein [Solirubrobacteraceae bacterium]